MLCSGVRKRQRALVRSVQVFQVFQRQSFPYLIIGLENEASVPQLSKKLREMLNFKHANNLRISLKLNEDIILRGIQEFCGIVKIIYYSYCKGISLC